MRFSPISEPKRKPTSRFTVGLAQDDQLAAGPRDLERERSDASAPAASNT